MEASYGKAGYVGQLSSGAPVFPVPPKGWVCFKVSNFQYSNLSKSMSTTFRVVKYWFSAIVMYKSTKFKVNGRDGSIFLPLRMC